MKRTWTPTPLSTGTIRSRSLSSAPDDVEIRIDEEPLETEIYGRWTWRPRGFAGLYQIQVRAPGRAVHTASVRVLPSKLSYERYQQMLVDIAHVAEDLAYQIRSPAGEKVSDRTLCQPFFGAQRVQTRALSYAGDGTDDGGDST